MRANGGPTQQLQLSGWLSPKSQQHFLLRNASSYFHVLVLTLGVGLQ